MKKITVLLPVDDTEAHLEAVCENTDFEIESTGNWGPSLGRHYFPRNVSLKETQINKKQRKNSDMVVGQLVVLPARDNSVIMFVPREKYDEIFEGLTGLVIKHFQDLNFLIETRAEPWRKSPDKNRERDKTIWECRNLGETWERTAELAKCGVTTAKERYFAMQRSLDDD